jgi:hypothetical protein
MKGIRGKKSDNIPHNGLKPFRAYRMPIGFLGGLPALLWR